MDLTVDFTETPVEPLYESQGSVPTENFLINANEVQLLERTMNGQGSVEEFLESVERKREELQTKNAGANEEQKGASNTAVSGPGKVTGGRMSESHSEKSACSIGMSEISSASLSDESNKAVLSVFFDIDKATLSSESKDKISAFADDIEGQCARVGGFASAIGDTDHNQTLSQKRAEEVAGYLDDEGVEVIKSQGMGDYQSKLWGSESAFQQRVDIHSISCQTD